MGVEYDMLPCYHIICRYTPYMFQYCITVPVLQYSFLFIRLIHHIINNNHNNIHKNTYYNDLLLTLPYPCALANNFVCILFALQGSSDSEGTRERCWLGHLSRIQQDLEDVKRVAVVSLGSLVTPSRFQPWSHMVADHSPKLA